MKCVLSFFASVCVAAVLSVHAEDDVSPVSLGMATTISAAELLATRDIDGDIEQNYVSVDLRFSEGYWSGSGSFSEKTSESPHSRLAQFKNTGVGYNEYSLQCGDFRYEGHAYVTISSTATESEKAGQSEEADLSGTRKFGETLKAVVSGWDQNGSPFTGTISWSIKTIAYDNR